MKKKLIILLMALFFISASSFAQGVEQALLFSQRNQVGNARTLGMGNAVTAVGGDLSAVSINPASSGLLKTSEFSISAGVTTAYNKGTYLKNSTVSDFSNFNIPNISFQTVTQLDSPGWKSVSFGVSVNRVADYSLTTNVNGLMNLSNTETMSSWLASNASSIMGLPWNTMDNVSYNNTSVPWKAILAYDLGLIQKWGYYGDGYYLASTENVYRNSADQPYATVDAPLTQSFSRSVEGSNDEFSINFSGNYGDFLFVGANLNIYSLSYESRELFQEASQNPYDFETKFDYLQHTYEQATSGTGVSFKVGAIVLPTKNLRLGVTLSSPTWYILTDKWFESMRGKVANSSDIYRETPVGSYSYRMTSPMRVGAGVAYTFGQVGLLSVDWEMSNYAGTRLRSPNEIKNIFDAENTYMRKEFLCSHILRAGVEVNVLPNLSLRGGYNYYSPVSKNRGFIKDSHYYSAGLGLRVGLRTFLDLAYQGQIAVDQKFTLYSDYDGIAAPVGYTQNNQGKFLATLRVKL